MYRNVTKRKEWWKNFTTECYRLWKLVRAKVTIRKQAKSMVCRGIPDKYKELVFNTKYHTTDPKLMI